MSLRINQNVLSIKTHGTLAATSSRLEKSIGRLSSGLRINTAADDAAGLAISEKMRRQIRGLARATLNAQDGISMLQTAEGALNESHSILQRMRELAIQSSNDTLTSTDRLEIQKEVVQLRDDLNRISRNTEFNTKKLLDGSQTALVSASSNAVKGRSVGLVDESGDYDVSISLLAAGIAQIQRTQIFTFNDSSGALAQGTTQLQSIAQFYDSNGVFVLDAPQTLTISGNSRSTSVVLDGQMTLDRLAAAIQNALVSGSGLEIDNSRSGVVNTAFTQVAGLGGYIELTSGTIGDLGKVSFASDQKVVDALGFAVNRQAVNSLSELTLRDSFGNIRQVRTEAAVATGLLEGIDLHFTSQSAQIAGTQGLQEGLRVNANQTFDISVGTAALTTFTISGSASSFWTMEGIARSINAQIAVVGTGMSGFSAAVVEGQIRLSYEKPDTVSGTVATTIQITNATNNAVIVGFVDGIYSGFVDARKNETFNEWGFSRFVATGTGVASGSTAAFTLTDGAGNTVTLTAYVSIGSATATMSDMVSFKEFQASANALLTTNSIAIRVDQVGGTLAFTSRRVGTENRDNNNAWTSMVSMVTDNSNANLEVIFKNQFGINEGTVKGTGDKNFRIHVVSNAPQFHIGADQGQDMAVSLSDMSADSLGVSNLDLTHVEGASHALARINKAIDLVAAERSKIGAFQNRLEYAVNNLRMTHSNLVASESRIRDADMAMEMVEFTRNQIVAQAGTAMLAQANLVPQGVLQLLQ